MDKIYTAKSSFSGQNICCKKKLLFIFILFYFYQVQIFQILSIKFTYIQFGWKLEEGLSNLITKNHQKEKR